MDVKHKLKGRLWVDILLKPIELESRSIVAKGWEEERIGSDGYSTSFGGVMKMF